MHARKPVSSRRTFLTSAIAASAYVWIPKPVTGYTAAEMRAMTIDKTKPGVSKWELDTPALCVDLDKMEKNVAIMQAAMKKYGLPSRPHSKTHKCAAIAKYQLATGSIGICCAKLSEAEAMVAHGVDKILMTTSNPSKNKIRRAMALRKGHSNFIQAVDEEQNARDLSAAAKEAGVTADVVIDVAVGTRSGIPAGEGVVALGQLIDKLPNLKLRGMLSYDGGVQHAKGFASRKERALKTIAANAETFADDEEGRPEHGNLQRRRHRHLQHHARGARLHRPAGRQLPVHGHAVPGHRQRERRRRCTPTSRRR